MTDLGPEPTGWELMRGMADLKAAVEKLGDKVVPLDVYNADKRGVDERFNRVESRVRDVEAAGVEGEKLRRATRLTITIAAVGPILAFALSYLAKVLP